MKARLKPGVRLREDAFGGICYVGHRDDFFAADKRVFGFLCRVPLEFGEVGDHERSAYEALAKLGICETEGPAVGEVPYSGPSFLGHFVEIPTVSEPLVLNCFSTAFCPLQCVYCHADDLMQAFRATELDSDLDNVIATARAIPSIVAVITGGDPIVRPERARRLIEELADQKALVFDTSGVGDIDPLLGLFAEHSVHVRVSLDTIDREKNGEARPINRAFVPLGASAWEGAQSTISKCLTADIAVTVQTVVSAKNEQESMWADLRDKLIDMGVRNWVLHIAVNAGAARVRERRHQLHRGRSVLPSRQAPQRVWSFIKKTIEGGYPIDIRCTDTGSSPNSVLLVGSKGDLFTEGYAHNGKVLLFNASLGRPDLVRALWPHLDRFGHARRYLNWNPGFFDGRSLEDICYQVPTPLDSVQEGPGLVENETKHKVLDPERLQAVLLSEGFKSDRSVLQRDEYYDDEEHNLASLDYVVRLRWEDGVSTVGLKGPRFFTQGGNYSRVELEFRGHDRSSIEQEMARRKLHVTWFLEKRRIQFRRPDSGLVVALDEIPEIGFFVEIEIGGQESAFDDLLRVIRPSLEAVAIRQNYAELFLAHKASQGVPSYGVHGAAFNS